MTRYTVKYPEGKERVKYITEDKGPSVFTKGKTRHYGPTRIYFKPSMNRFITRKAGVERTSKKVREINKLLKDTKGTVNTPPIKCGGKDWSDFVVCLGEQMEALLKGYTRVERKTASPEEFMKLSAAE